MAAGIVSPWGRFAKALKKRAEKRAMVKGLVNLRVKQALVRVGVRPKNPSNKVPRFPVIRQRTVAPTLGEFVPVKGCN